IGPSFLHPIRRELTAESIREADGTFRFIHADRQDFDVRAQDGVLLRGWLVRPANANGSWVLVFHGVADNRAGVIGQAEMLLRDGYSVVMMDARAHGASEGPMATYGWLERTDTKAVIDALLVEERERDINMQKDTPFLRGDPRHVAQPLHIFALGESMGAGIALQS